MRELRLLHSLTQEETAELVGISLRHYRTIETGLKKKIWLGTVESLARAFGLEPCQLIAPDFRELAKPRFDVVKSSIHYQRRRKGPYQKKSLEVGNCMAQPANS